MGRVNISAIENICKEKLNTSSIQKQISKAQKQAIVSGKAPRGVSALQMQEAGRKLLDMILNNLPDSLSRLKSLLSTSVSEIKNGDGYYQIDIEFPAEVVRRKSLCPEKYDDVENIVSLFNNGYKARNNVYGYWATAGKRVTSVASRPSLQFMQNAIDNFNNIYAHQYSCHAELGEQYKKR